MSLIILIPVLIKTFSISFFYSAEFADDDISDGADVRDNDDVDDYLDDDVMDSNEVRPGKMSKERWMARQGMDSEALEEMKRGPGRRQRKQGNRLENKRQRKVERKEVRQERKEGRKDNREERRGSIRRARGQIN